MKILVTGHKGFIGKHVFRIAEERGHEVYGVDRKLGSYLSGTNVSKFDVVIHLAADIDIKESFENPWKYVDNNISNLKWLSSAKRVVFASSAAVYGRFSPYGYTKRLGEVLLPENSVSLRMFNPFGPGERHEPETHIVPLLAESILNDKELTLYMRGEQIRDFIHVKDAALAFVIAAESDIVGDYQLGDTHLSIRQVADLMGAKYVLDDSKRDEGDTGALMSNGSIELKKDTYWRPTHDVRKELENWREWYHAVK